MSPTSPSPDPSQAPGQPDTAASAGRRVGHLYPQVAAYLASRPDDLLKVGDITRAIGAPSSGAVFEALKRMTTAGYATHHTGPHRLQITEAGIHPAAPLPPPAPPPS